MNIFKACDKISWRFLFFVVEKMGIVVEWVELFFINSLVAANLNGNPYNYFKIEKG
jgi:hypothetical protein